MKFRALYIRYLFFQACSPVQKPTSGFNLRYGVALCRKVVLSHIFHSQVPIAYFTFACYSLLFNRILNVNGAWSEYEGESIKNQPNLFLGEIDRFFFDAIAL